MKESVRKCLECTKPKCDNCVTRKKNATNRIAEAEFLELYNLGYSDAQIAEALDVPKVNVGPYRWRKGLKPNKAINKAIKIAVDAVEVVRCKDCYHKEESMVDGCVWCNEHAKMMLETDFCSYGERKENAID